MRHAPLPGVLLLCLLSAPALAQVGKDIRFVNVPSAEVFCGPASSSAFYVTNRLQQGTPVEVTQELSGGWLAIRPPEGSFSYINTRFLRHLDPDQPNHVVNLDGIKVPVYVGSEVVDRRPTVAGAWLERGAQVVRRGKPKSDNEGSWLPIDPPEQERRYIRAELVSRTPPEHGSRGRAVVAVPASRAGFTPAQGAPASAVPSANPQPTPQELLERAKQADRDGNVAEAIRLYRCVYAATAYTQPDLAAAAAARGQYLEAGYQNYGAGTGLAVPPAASARSPGPRQQAQLGPPAAPGAVTTTTIRRDSSAFTPAPGTGPARPPVQSPHWRWVTDSGLLARAGRTLAGVPTYRLDDPQTLAPRAYVTPERGVDLESHIGKVVSVQGWSHYRGELRTNYTYVKYVYPGR